MPIASNVSPRVLLMFTDIYKCEAVRKLTPTSDLALRKTLKKSFQR